MKKLPLLFITFIALLCLSSCNEKKEPAQDGGGSDTPGGGDTPIEGQVIDKCGNTYNVVKIGNRYWMTENMRCDKYDTESEASGSVVPLHADKSTVVYDPWYADASDAEYWSESTKQYAVNVTDDVRAKLGYLYNWAAAAGVATEADAKAITDVFSSNRQGICPNGFHLPTVSDFSDLAMAVGGEPSKFTAGRFNGAGTALKAKSGWYSGNATDKFGFAGYPAGRSLSRNVSYTGYLTEFWTADANGSNYAVSGVLAYNTDLLDLYVSKENANNSKNSGKSVRCVSNDEITLESLLYSDVELIETRSVKVKYKVEPSVFDMSVITYKSSDEKIATIDSKGIVTGVKPGEVVITPMLYGSVPMTDHQFKVTVSKLVVTKVKMKHSQYSMSGREQSTLSFTVEPEDAPYSKVVWKSSNESVATVDQNGVVTSFYPGTTTISCTVDGVIGASFVTVEDVPVEYIWLNPTMAYLRAPNETCHITASVRPEHACYQDITLRIKQSSGGFRLSEDGVLSIGTARDGDVCIIEAKAHNGITATTTIIIDYYYKN